MIRIIPTTYVPHCKSLKVKVHEVLVHGEVWEAAACQNEVTRFWVQQNRCEKNLLTGFLLVLIEASGPPEEEPSTQRGAEPEEEPSTQRDPEPEDETSGGTWTSVLSLLQQAPWIKPETCHNLDYLVTIMSAA